jgi:hypothetical protein
MVNFSSLLISRFWKADRDFAGFSRQFVRSLIYPDYI